MGHYIGIICSLQGYWDIFCPNTFPGGEVSENKKVDLKAHILDLLEQKSEINLQDVAEASGLSRTNPADRKAIGRMFQTLTKLGLLEAKGAARARVYIRTVPLVTAASTTTAVAAAADDAFKNIQLSNESKNLIDYVSQSIGARKPVGYNQDFLRSYKPNETFFLTEVNRSELFKVGRVEDKTRPAGTYARTILNRLLIDLSWNSSRLEGNTYSLLETKRLIELGESAIGKDTTETQMILNHKGAIEYIMDSAEETVISSHDVRSIHGLLSENLLGDPSASGRVRQIAVGIGGTTYMPLENPHVLQECFDVFIEKLNQIHDPFEQSFFSMVHLSYMQAFEDVNKRTARLVANIPLIKKNLKPLSFIDVNQEAYVKSLIGVYEKNDISLLCDLYMWAYRRSSDKYSAIQQAPGESNPLKLKYRILITEIIQSVILGKIPGAQVVSKIRDLLEANPLPEADRTELFKLIETEISSLHDGNIARFKIRPGQFMEWKNLK